MTTRWFSTTLVLAYGGGLGLHWLHRGQRETVEIAPVLHWVRDSSLAIPLALAAVTGGGIAARWVSGRARPHRSPVVDSLAATLVTALLYATGSIPGNLVHARLFVAEHLEGHAGVALEGWQHLMRDSGAALVAGLGALLIHSGCLELARLRRVLGEPPTPSPAGASRSAPLAPRIPQG